ncbi:hypothetical protein [Lysobacter sp. HDW10]|uniref:hypothetical protein n=1 Tax=Lysobacter sp. HDW10 TaxID=2714936 RepID=UPI00197C3AC8|nr:hypothetical protein [Lysobacter sp. HDW10]
MFSPPPLYTALSTAPWINVHLTVVAVLLAVTAAFVVALVLECAVRLYDYIEHRVARRRRERAFRRSVRF